MADSSQLLIKTPEDLGRQVAREFERLFRWETTKAFEEQLERVRVANMTSQLRRALYLAVDGYNESVPIRYQLVILDRATHLIFRTVEDAALKLVWGKHQVLLEPMESGERSFGLMVLDVWRDETGLQLKLVSDSAYFSEATITEAEFVSTVLRMACHYSFDQPLGLPGRS